MPSSVRLSVLLLPVFLMLACSWCLADGGRRATFTLRDSSEITGEILAVSDSQAIVTKNCWASEKELRKDTGSLVKIPASQVAHLVLAGNAHSGDGMKAGILAGMVAGGLAGYYAGGPEQSLRSTHALVGALGGVFPGLLVGAIVGGAIVTGDEPIGPLDAKQWKALASQSRYKEGIVPEFILQSAQVPEAR